eukprot:3126601-Rhodomonas_salina.3
MKSKQISVHAHRMQRGVSAALEATRRCAMLQGHSRLALQALTELGCAPARSFSTAAAKKPDKWSLPSLSPTSAVSSLLAGRAANTERQPASVPRHP